MSNLPNLPPIPVPNALSSRMWDFVVQGVADAFAHHGRDDVARRIEHFRASPNLHRLMTDAVIEGWAFWLERSHAHAIVAAVKRDVQDHLPTLIRIHMLDALQRPITREDVEDYLAEWFRELQSGASPHQCRSAARELLDRILQAALSADPLRSLVQTVLLWESKHRQHLPTLGPRIAKVRQIACERAKADGYAFVSSAHLMYGLAALEPPHAPQQVMRAAGIGVHAILTAIAAVPFREAKISSPEATPSPEPEESSSVGTILGEAQERAAEEKARAADDGHLLRGALAIAADPYCTCGGSLRVLFSALNVDPSKWADALTLYHSWPSINTSLGIQLSLNGI